MADAKVTLQTIFSITNRIEDKLDQAEIRHQETIRELSKRVSTLELWKAEIVGKASLLVAVLTVSISLVWGLVWDWVRKRLNL